MDYWGSHKSNRVSILDGACGVRSYLWRGRNRNLYIHVWLWNKTRTLYCSGDGHSLIIIIDGAINHYRTVVRRTPNRLLFGPTASTERSPNKLYDRCASPDQTLAVTPHTPPPSRFPSKITNRNDRLRHAAGPSAGKYDETGGGGGGGDGPGLNRVTMLRGEWKK